MDHLIQVWGHAGASIVFGVIWYKLFRWADNFFPEHTKQALSDKLNNLRPDSWVLPVVSVFDHLLARSGKQNSFRPSFWRSCCLSIFWVTVLFCVFCISNSSFRLTIFEFIQERGWLFALLILLLIAIVLNCALDYISIFQTRLVLHWLTLQNTSGKIISLVFLDFVATGLLALTGFSIIVNAISNAGNIFFEQVLCEIPAFCVRREEISLRDTVSELFESLKFKDESSYLSVYILTTFMTSVWIWLYAFSELILRRLPNPFKKWFPISTHPFQSLGCIASVLAGVLYFIFMGLP